MKLTIASALSTLENRGFTRVPNSLLTLANGNVNAALAVGNSWYIITVPDYRPLVGTTVEELNAALDTLFTPEGVPYASEGEMESVVSEGLAEIRSIFESESLPLVDLDFIEVKAALIQGETARAIVDKFRASFDSDEDNSPIDALRIRKPEGRSESPLKPFTSTDWTYLAGAERFPDGSEPLTASLSDNVMLIVDASGLEIANNEDESRYTLSIARPYVTKKVVIAIAEGIIREVMETSLNSTILEAYGFVRTV